VTAHPRHLLLARAQSTGNPAPGRASVCCADRTTGIRRLAIETLSTGEEIPEAPEYSIGTATLETSFSYFDSIAYEWQDGRLAQITLPDGSEITYDYRQQENRLASAGISKVTHAAGTAVKSFPTK